jgi:hypothetical protein
MFQRYMLLPSSGSACRLGEFPCMCRFTVCLKESPGGGGGIVPGALSGPTGAVDQGSCERLETLLRVTEFTRS